MVSFGPALTLFRQSAIKPRRGEARPWGCCLSNLLGQTALLSVLASIRRWRCQFQVCRLSQVLQSAKGLIHVKYLRLSSFWPAVTIVTAATQSNKGVQAKAPTKYITNLWYRPKHAHCIWISISPGKIGKWIILHMICTTRLGYLTHRYDDVAMFVNLAPPPRIKCPLSPFHQSTK